jgi:hypothetical protein
MDIKKRKVTGVLAEMLKHIDKESLELTRLKMEMETMTDDSPKEYDCINTESPINI